MSGNKRNDWDYRRKTRRMSYPEMYNASYNDTDEYYEYYTRERRPPWEIERRRRHSRGPHYYSRYPSGYEAEEEHYAPPNYYRYSSSSSRYTPPAPPTETVNTSATATTTTEKSNISNISNIKKDQHKSLLKREVDGVDRLDGVDGDRLDEDKTDKIDKNNNSKSEYVIEHIKKIGKSVHEPINTNLLTHTNQQLQQLNTNNPPNQPNQSNQPIYIHRIPSKMLSVYSYIVAKMRVEKEEKERVKYINAALKKEKVVDNEEEIAFWSEKKNIEALKIEENMEESMSLAEERSKKNEADIPDIIPNEITVYLYNTVIKDPKGLHRRNNLVQTYVGEDAMLKKAFAEIGKDFNRIRQEFLPWRTMKEIVMLYYQKKYILKLKSWQNAYKDTRKLADADLKELVEREWTEEEKKTFAELFPKTGKKWAVYINGIKGKTEGNIKAYYKYYKRFVYREREREAETAAKEAKKKEEKSKKDEVDIKAWRAHERQIFALIFPHIGKSWNVLANYIITKNASEIRGYHRTYYKNLSAGEKILETHLQEIGDPEIRTDPLPLSKRSGYSQINTMSAGVLFVYTQKQV